MIFVWFSCRYIYHGPGMGPMWEMSSPWVSQLALLIGPVPRQGHHIHRSSIHGLGRPSLPKGWVEWAPFGLSNGNLEDVGIHLYIYIFYIYYMGKAYWVVKVKLIKGSKILHVSGNPTYSFDLGMFFLRLWVEDNSQSQWSNLKCLCTI